MGQKWKLLYLLQVHPVQFPARTGFVLTPRAGAAAAGHILLSGDALFRGRPLQNPQLWRMELREERPALGLSPQKLSLAPMVQMPVSTPHRGYFIFRP
jgi:hypothetical protein